MYEAAVKWHKFGHLHTHYDTDIADRWQRWHWNVSSNLIAICENKSVVAGVRDVKAAEGIFLTIKLGGC